MVLSPESARSLDSVVGGRYGIEVGKCICLQHIGRFMTEEMETGVDGLSTVLGKNSCHFRSPTSDLVRFHQP